MCADQSYGVAECALTSRATKERKNVANRAIAQLTLSNVRPAVCNISSLLSSSFNAFSVTRNCHVLPTMRSLPPLSKHGSIRVAIIMMRVG